MWVAGWASVTWRPSASVRVIGVGVGARVGAWVGMVVGSTVGASVAGTSVGAATGGRVAAGPQAARVKPSEIRIETIVLRIIISIGKAQSGLRKLNYALRYTHSLNLGINNKALVSRQGLGSI